jgi:hypothetical protein
MNSFQNQQSAFGVPASLPSRHKETKSGIAAPHARRIDVGVMPAMRPDAISNRVRLAYEFTALVRSFIPERSTVDTLLPVPCPLVDAVVTKYFPNKQGVPLCRSQANIIPGSDKLLGLAAIRVGAMRVVASV